MRKLLRLSAVSAAALALALAPLPGFVSLGNWVGVVSVYAGGGNSGNHGNSGGNGNNGNSGADHSNGSNSNGSDGATHSNNKGGNSDHGNIASLAGFGNAAHASVQGLLHANPHSAVGRLKVYADLEFSLRALQATVVTDQGIVDADKLAIAADQKLLDAAKTGGDATVIAAAQKVLDDANAKLAKDQLALDGATADLATATDNADAAFALATRNPDNPAVKTYIDGLLAKYYAYLGQP